MAVNLSDLGVDATPAARAWCTENGVQRLTDLEHATEAERAEFIATLALKPIGTRKFAADLARRLAAQPSGLADAGRTSKRPIGQLLIYACSPSLAPLANVAIEADEVMIHCDAVVSSGTAERLRQILVNMRPRCFLFAGHADTKLNGERTLAFTDDRGGLCVAQPSALSSMLHDVRQGCPDALELVFLNGCCSEVLGRAVHEDAGVPWVVCWRTPCNDEAARLFSVKFFQALGRAGYRDAFRQAKSAVELYTHPGRLANGVPANVPKFFFRDPAGRLPAPPRHRDIDTAALDVSDGIVNSNAPNEHTMAVATPAPIAAGLPLLLYTGGEM